MDDDKTLTREEYMALRFSEVTEQLFEMAADEQWTRIELAESVGAMFLTTCRALDFDPIEILNDVIKVAPQ